MQKLTTIMFVAAIIIACGNSTPIRPSPQAPEPAKVSFCASKENCGLCASEGVCVYCAFSKKCLSFLDQMSCAERPVSIPEACP